MREEYNQGGQTSINDVDADEVKLCEVAKHPIGVFVIFAQAVIGMVLVVGLSFFLVPTMIDDSDEAFMIVAVITLATVVFAVGAALLVSSVYRQNRLIVTDRNITQILQYSLFSRKVSQLNLVNVEDVTSVQNGIFSTIFGYGELKIETAGEQSNFHFTYCPRSGYYAKIILNAREKLLGQHEVDLPVDQTSRHK